MSTHLHLICTKLYVVNVTYKSSSIQNSNFDGLIKQ